MVKQLAQYILFVFIFLNGAMALGQTRTDSAQTEQIKIIKADEGTSHPTYTNTHILSGNVIFEHDSTLMYCDSAYFFLDSNVFHAFSNIRVLRGDSIRLTGDTLYYRGIDKTADLLGNIDYTDRQMNLKTSKLFYDFNTEIGKYTESAVITSIEDKNTLTSKKGYYHSDIQTVYFKDSVTLKNEEYTMICDTLSYQTNTKIAHFHGPTEIISKANTIYCENGVYDTENETSSLWTCAQIFGKEQTISGDSIYYNRTLGIGEVYGNVIMEDTTNKVILIGENGVHNELLDSTSVFGHAQMTQFGEKDTLFLSASYLTIKTDSVNENKKIRAYDSVRIYQKEFQAICDSLVYFDSDSLMRFYHNPVLWSDKNQISGKYIEAKTKKNVIDFLTVNKDAFIISEIDTTMYDQIKGKDLFAYFKEGKINKVDVIGNGQTLYHIMNDDSVYLEANSAKCSSLHISFLDQSIHTIRFIETPTAQYQSIDKMSQTDKFFENFKWMLVYKPLKNQFTLIPLTEN